MIDHISITVPDLKRSTEFYRTALAPLGYRVLVEFEGVVGLGGNDGMPDLWIAQGASVSGPVHLAFRTATRIAVDAFHAAALKNGGRDNGKPGLRAHYHPAYYGAFVLDPDGHNVEAVCHLPE